LNLTFIRYVGKLTDPDGLRQAIELAAQKHCALQVRAEHYPIVYESFMWAVGEVLGEAVTPEVADAWGKVVLFIARAMIERELEIYAEQQAKNFGWFGWKVCCPSLCPSLTLVRILKSLPREETLI
jgi:nitric oxide dioxygenase